MSLLFSDTHPKIEKMQIEIIRNMPAWKKISIVNGLNNSVKQMAVAGILERNPGATPDQVKRMLADLLLGQELARKVYDHAR